MATARGQKSQEQGLGTVEKFTNERFFRKSQEKPYDRPPTALRTSGSDSWILKLVDPVQRLISSVTSESNQSRKDDKKADGMYAHLLAKDPFEVQVATSVVDNRNKSDRFEMMELEKTLKQKTFTRSEIDHLTTLLHSRNVDFPVVNEEKKIEFISSIPESNRREFVKVPNSEVKMGRQLISTPILSSSVLDGDISTPAEIARAYMRSRQPKGLKRRSSFLYSHIGSTVPPRRIRQKRNIHLSKGLSLPVSARPISVPVDGLTFDASQSSKFGKVQHFPSSIRNSQLSLKPKKSCARKFIMNVQSDNIPGSGSSSIYTPSRSYKMASKILEQLDKLTPRKEKASTFNRLPVGEKSPPKLSPSTVGGHLRSVKDVDLLRSKEFVHDDKLSNSLNWIPYHANRDHNFQNKEKLENMKPLDPHHRYALLNDSGSIGSSKDSMNDLGVPAPTVVKSTIEPPKNKPAHQMWRNKDSVEHDESSVDRVAPVIVEIREGDISLDVTQTTGNEAAVKPQTTSEVIVGSPLNRNSDLKISDGSVDDDMDTRFTFQNASSFCTTSQLETIDSAPTDSFQNKDFPEDKQRDSPVFSFGNNVSPRKQPNSSSTAFDVRNKDASLTESRAAPENGNGAPYPYTQCNPASSYSDVQESVYLNADISSNHKLDRSWGTCNDAFSLSASVPAGLAFSFSSFASHQSLNNGTSISCPSLFSSYSSPTVCMSQSSSRNIFLSATSVGDSTNITTTNNHPSTTNLAPSSSPLSLHDTNDAHFGGSITTSANSHYSTFTFGAASTPSSANNQLSTPTVSRATELSAQEVSAGKEFTAKVERASIILGSSKSLASSGLAGKASVRSGISFGCSSPASELFNLGNRPSEFPIVGFTSAPATSTVGTSNVSTSKAFLCFKSCTGASFSSICPTISAATTLAGFSSKPVSSNSHLEVAFRVSSGNNDYEEQRVSSGNNDCEVQGISKDNVPLFSQKPIVPPSSGFSFAPATSELNPFQVGKQQTLAEPQNSYPYIASSSSLDAEARGSFSSSVDVGNKASWRFVKVKRKK